MICIKRVYEARARDDGKRFLVERLWPRGMKKATLRGVVWLKEVAPSTELRLWFGHQPVRWQAFRKRYRKELSAKQDAWTPLIEAGRKSTITLLYSAHDVKHNGATVLREYLSERLRQPRK